MKEREVRMSGPGLALLLGRQCCLGEEELLRLCGTVVEQQHTKHTDQGELQATQLKLSISHWHRISSPHTVVDYSSNSLNLEMFLNEEEGNMSIMCSS